ncbi:hypothetical protein K9M74_04775 [Candidatus Woesearchaeota archaeon]|nr:hypothetical protein [Candidatus Woesearchaeota archaeon]
MKYKAQAALEFLTTYGWAFLAALVVIGALASFGLGDLRSQVPNSCFLGPAFTCYGASADGRGVVLIEFSPIQKVHIERMMCTYPDGTELVQTYSSEPLVMPNQEYIIGCQETGLALGKHKDKFIVSLVYHLNETGALPRIANGDIVTDISEADLDFGSLISPTLSRD